ncbi:MAG TPA: secretin N-terminal domain-containing protein [Gallionella sp.]|nr:secretin N-terminal domain-containing protein [Gallionella sp.]
MRTILWLGAVLLIAGCATPKVDTRTAQAIQHEMDRAVQDSTQADKADSAVNNALLPPLTLDMPGVENKPLETRFDLAVNNTPVSQVFMAIVSGTRYSMLLPPDVSGNISLNLKDVTVFDALETIRQIYGYEYKVDDNRIYIQPIALQTRIFQVNYLTGTRAGTSLLHVISGSVSDSPTGGTTGSSTTTASPTSSALDSSRVTTTDKTDFWTELEKSLKAIVGTETGRSVVVSPISGVIVVRAMPDEMRNISAYLKASQISVERQVILEAKIVEVQLSDGYQSGVNWAAFKNNPNSRLAVGPISSNSVLATTGPLTNGQLAAIPGRALVSGAVTIPSSGLSATTAATGSLFGLAFQTGNFAALLNFLESQGNVHVLSSPRIATINNQKAILKVGTDDFFVTNVSTTTTTGTATTTTPTITVQPFFSGIALDVTPRIDENNEIILHVHPSVSQVTQKNLSVNLGAASGGTLTLPLASSSVSETDSIVRARDGQIVAIGGLMRQASADDRSGLPGLPKTLFGQTSQSTEKRELIILLKPTIVDSNKDWSQDITSSRDRLNGMAGQDANP